MSERDLSHKTKRNLRKLNVHVKLTADELAALEAEMQRFGLDSRSAMARILLRKALALN